MSSRSLLVVLLILTCLQSFTTSQNSSGPKQCCFNYQKKQIPLGLIEKYDEAEHRCSKPGVIFTLKDSRLVCADPGIEWVKKTMTQIDELMFKGPRQS